MTHPTDDQIDAAIAELRKIIDAAENSNHAGEVALMKAANAGELFEHVKLLERSLVYEIRKSSVKGDDEGANLKRYTLQLVRQTIATAHPFADDEPEPADPETIAQREHSAAESLTDAGRGHLNVRGY